MFGSPYRMSGSSQLSLPDVWEWSGDPPGCPGVLKRPFRMSLSGGRPFRMSWSGWKALPDVSEWWEALLDVLEWPGGPPGYPGVFEWLS